MIVNGDPRPAPARVASEVNDWAAGEIARASKYENAELLDASSVYGLHELARLIYSMGWQEGRIYQTEVSRKS